MTKHVHLLRTIACLTLILFALTACGSTAPTSNPPTGAGNTTEPAAPDNSNTGNATQETTVQGLISQVEGSKLIVEGMGGSSVTIEVTDTTKVQMQQFGSVSDIQVGLPVLITGIKQGETYQAIEIQVGIDEPPLRGMQPSLTTAAVPEGGNSGGGSGPIMIMPGQEGSAPNALPADIGMPATLEGTVASLDGSSLVLNTSDGQTITVVLGEPIFVQKVTKASAADAQRGLAVFAVGVRSDNRFEVERLRLIVPPNF